MQTRHLHVRRQCRYSYVNRQNHQTNTASDSQRYILHFPIVKALVVAQFFQIELRLSTHLRAIKAQRNEQTATTYIVLDLKQIVER